MSDKFQTLYLPSWQTVGCPVTHSMGLFWDGLPLRFELQPLPCMESQISLGLLSYQWQDNMISAHQSNTSWILFLRSTGAWELRASLAMKHNTEDAIVCMHCQVVPCCIVENSGFLSAWPISFQEKVGARHAKKVSRTTKKNFLEICPKLSEMSNLHHVHWEDSIWGWKSKPILICWSSLWSYNISQKGVLRDDIYCLGSALSFATCSCWTCRKPQQALILWCYHC